VQQDIVHKDVIERSSLFFSISRIEMEFQSLADRYYPQNIVVVSHGYGVTQAIDMCKGRNYGTADFCGCVELCRTSKTSSEWKLAYYNKQVYI
jgi:hypothetical protein